MKRKVFQPPTNEMEKGEVDEKRLTSFVLIPEGNYSSLNKTLGRALDPHANGTWLSKLTE